MMSVSDPIAGPWILASALSRERTALATTLSRSQPTSLPSRYTILPAIITWRTARVSIMVTIRSEEHTSELQSHVNLVCRLLLEKKKTKPTGVDGEHDPHVQLGQHPQLVIHAHDSMIQLIQFQTAPARMYNNHRRLHEHVHTTAG